MPRRKFWGWGYEGSGLDADELRGLAALLEAQLGVPAGDPVEPPQVDELELRSSRIAAPAALERLCTSDPHERAGHAYGKSYRDLVRALRREFPEPPDLVALPESEQDVAAILDWCAGSRIAVVPYGGGSSVVGGVEPDVGDGFAGTVSLDLRRLGRVLHVDERSRAAEVEAGVLGPSLEEQLQPHGLTFRHFPQSFEFSTLGGWIATRSGGHYATGPTHVDEQVEALTVVTPAGLLETRRLPAGGAGPAPERLFCGSEGSLGVITRAWVRLQERAEFRAGASVRLRALRGRNRGDARDRALQPPSRELPPARSRRGRPLRQRRRHERDPRPRFRGLRSGGRRRARTRCGALPRSRRHRARRNGGCDLAVGVPPAAVRL